MQIKDGAGKGYWAQVDELNRLHTVATSRSEIQYISAIKRDAYSITTNNYTFNSTNEHPWLYIENKDTTHNLIFDSIIYSFNGGDTNHNRTLIKRVYRNPPQPTTNITSLEPTNLNFGSVRRPETNIYSWDGSNTDGMEVNLTNTKNTLTSTVQAGTLVLSDVEGLIMTFGTSVLISFEPEEIGMASISVKIFLQ